MKDQRQITGENLTGSENPKGTKPQAGNSTRKDFITIGIAVIVAVIAIALIF